MKAADIRERFLKFFEQEGHARVASSSLIPADDPTLLFANAGMNQFKDCFLGREKRDYQTACTSQKCVRAGGKHNDLDNVGYTARHHTFFEMLGNFSFGDYFKERAIDLAWRFLTVELGLPTDRLYVTVFQDDDEAFGIWRDQIGVPADRIFRFGKKDNFWAMGDTGPCGPCSEIFYDYGPEVPGGNDPYEGIASGSDRYVEVWNLVFMQFDCAEDGTLTPLPNPSIDTGMGLERISSVVQGCLTNYDTDLFRDIIDPTAKMLGVAYGQDPETDAGLRVIADHLRAMSFLIADGVVPTNEGRGYVLRRIMRRAMRFGKQLGRKEPFLHQLIQFVVEKMGSHYPELERESNQIVLLAKVEEQNFDATLTKGMPVLQRYLNQLRQQGQTEVPGQVIHLLYGTHGFPLDLMADIARDWGMTLKEDEFKTIMAEEAQMANSSTDFAAKKVPPALEALAAKLTCKHLIYGDLHGKGNIVQLMTGDQPAEILTEGCEGEVITDSTVFYAESGGQIGDCGQIETDSGVFEVSHTSKVLDRLVLHHGKIVRGEMRVGQAASMQVDAAKRSPTMKNHTATHLMHQALRDVLGQHVRQAGSLVDDQKLRFDFSHFAPMTNEEIIEVENRVNQQIQANTTLQTEVMPIDKAREQGAMALFGEKYGDQVRVVSIGDYSLELCGGTHVHATGEIGAFKIVAEKGLASGIRRITALTGPRVIQRFQESEQLLKTAQDHYFLKRETFLAQLQQKSEEKKALEGQIEALKIKIATGGQAAEQLETIGEFKVLLKRVDDVEGGQLRQLADELMGRVKKGVVLLGADLGGKAQLLVKVRDCDVHAGNLVKEMAPIVDGRGGGKPDMAMAGGKNTAKLQDALDAGLEKLKTLL